MMTAVPMKTASPFEETLKRLIQDSQMLDGKQPEWLVALQRSAVKQFEATRLPKRRQEAWRFVDLSALLSQSFTPFAPQTATTLTPAALDPHLLTESANSRLVFVNGFYNPALSSVSGLPDGMQLLDLNTAFAQCPERMGTYLGQAATSETDPFALLNTALFTQGAFCHVPDNVQCESPVELVFVTTASEGMASPKVLVSAGKHAQAYVILRFIGLEKQATYLNNVSLDVFADEEAHLELVHVQSESLGAFEMATTRIRQQTNSQVTTMHVALGGQLSRNNLDIKLLGENASCQSYGLTVLEDHTHVHHHTVIDHVEPRCTSEQLYKGILDDASRSEFDGTIFIREGAVSSDAAQLNQNLLLSEDARVFTRPQLRIDNDDVKCAHGATVGQLEDSQLFYLASRGLSQDTAQTLLTLGFAEEILDKLTLPALRKQLMQQVYWNLHLSDNPNANRETLLPWST